MPCTPSCCGNSEVGVLSVAATEAPPAVLLCLFILRYINSMAVKAMFKAGRSDEGEKLAALFTRDAVKGEQVGGLSWTLYVGYRAASKPCPNPPCALVNMLWVLHGPWGLCSDLSHVLLCRMRHCQEAATAVLSHPP